MCDASTDDQARLVRAGVVPGRTPRWSDTCRWAICQERTRLCSSSHCATTNTSVAPGSAGKDASDADALIFRQDTFGAALTAVIDEVVGVPSGAAGAHLGQPRPDVMRRTPNRDGVIDRAEGLRNQVVSGKSPGLLARSGADLPAGINRNCCEDYQHSGKYKQHPFLHLLHHLPAQRLALTFPVSTGEKDHMVA